MKRCQCGGNMIYYGYTSRGRRRLRCKRCGKTEVACPCWCHRVRLLAWERTIRALDTLKLGWDLKVICRLFSIPERRLRRWVKNGAESCSHCKKTYYRPT